MKRPICSLPIVILLLLGALVLPGLSSAAATEGADPPGSGLRPVTLAPLWSPQAQFAGYYVAMDKGIYARHGIDLTIIPGGPELDPVELLAAGTADFAVLWLATAIERRERGVELINVAQFNPRSSIMLVARKDSGIKEPADLAGRRVGLWSGGLGIPPRIFFSRHQLRVEEVTQSYTVNLFLRGGLDATSAMWYNEYHTIYLAGHDFDELTVFSLHDHGVNFPEDGLYTLAATKRRDPELVAAFVRASLEGWRYAFAHPDETIDIIIKHMRAAKLPANRQHQRWMLERMQDLMGGKELVAAEGRLQPEGYRAAAEAMQQFGLIHEIVDYEVFTGGDDAGQ